VKRNKSKELKQSQYSDFVDEIFSAQELGIVLSRSDVVVDTLPITIETKAVFDVRAFSEMKTHCIFINIGRGQTVVEKDLIEALKSQKILAAGLDVFETEPLPVDSPLWKLGNVIISPHVSGNAPFYFERGFEILAENLERYSKGDRLKNLVDLNAGY
jgi:phosphoglycerate dehydrogenase-like enzyme